MNILKRFGSGSKLYTFPVGKQISYSDNFASLVTKTVRLAGVNGGFSNLGGGRGLSPIGTVRADVWLIFPTTTEAVDYINALDQMVDWGLQPLFRQPLYGAEQLCFARITDIQRNQDVHNRPDVRQKVTVVFEVPDPFWYRTVSGAGILWDGGALWDDGSIWDATTGYLVSGSATWPFTNNGNYYTLPRLSLVNASGSSVGDIRVQRIVDGVAEDDCIYLANLATATYLDIDPARLRVRVGPVGTDALDHFEAKSPDWLRLNPGSNSLKVTCSGTLTLYLQYMERFI
jgi:hypothetical protein